MKKEDPYASMEKDKEDFIGMNGASMTSVSAGVEIFVIYHTFIETCKMCGVSTLEYFKEFFKAAIKRGQFRIHSRNVERKQAQVMLKAIMQGRTDYENLLPMTIGIKK
jgi:hypothetical protein